MKDKRIIAMFITSCVALVASVVITLGVALTLADPVPATDVLRTSFNFGASNSETISGSFEDALVYENAVVLQPSGSLHVENWDIATMNTNDEANMKTDAAGNKVMKTASPLYFSAEEAVNPTYESEIMYENESLPSKVEFVTLRVSNSTEAAIKVAVDTIHSTQSSIGKYTKTVVFDCATYDYYSYDELVLAAPEFEIAAGESRDFIMMIYVDEYANNQDDIIEYGSAKESVSVVVRNITK
ncbi:MAG: hypothetical protein IJW24_04965 [Clostridia bacterium]|nr:hypothetical protein [Clostridia bacterium]